MRTDSRVVFTLLERVREAWRAGNDLDLDLGGGIMGEFSV